MYFILTSSKNRTWSGQCIRLHIAVAKLNFMDFILQEVMLDSAVAFSSLKNEEARSK